MAGTAFVIVPDRMWLEFWPLPTGDVQVQAHEIEPDGRHIFGAWPDLPPAAVAPMVDEWLATTALEVGLPPRTTVPPPD